jgi:succinyl-diaminopimelate desuccinylase
VAEIAEALAARTLALVDIPSESRSEQAIADYVAGEMPWEPAWRDGETLWYATGGDRSLVVLAGHTDTVPAQGNIPGRREDGRVVGLGASDMKGGLAVMIELARWVATERPRLAVELGFVFFPREELPVERSALPRFFEGVPQAREAELAIVLEPTDNTIQAGCLGNLEAVLRVRGESAHSARPWLGVNAIERAVETLAPVLRVEPREVEVGGLTFVEVLSPTGIRGGIATNVIPDLVEVDLNFRYAPGRTPAEAEAWLRELTAGELEVVGNSPPAPVVAERPLVERLREAGDFEVAPKQAWTPVAEFAAAGVDAVNLGPGATRYAHKADEQVEAAELERTFEALRRFASV